MEGLQELIDLLNEIKFRYDTLDDNKVEDAFSLMRDSSSLLSSFEQAVADMQKVYADEERMAKAFQAETSFKLSNSVANGDRQASFNTDVIERWERVSSVMKSVRYLEAQSRLLSRIYFDSKMVTENCYRHLRPPVGENRIVGRT